MVNRSLIQRSTPSKRPSYKDYEEDLRKDFFCSCAYCSSMEIEAGIGFSIDHYIPKSKPEGKLLENEFSNLLWVCSQCNSRKKDFLPNPEQKARGHIIIRPDEMIGADHICCDPDNPNELKGKTTTGEFHIQRLFLNKRGHVIIRQKRRELLDDAHYVLEGIRSLRKVAFDNLKQSDKGPYQRFYKEVLKKHDSVVAGEMDELLRTYASSPHNITDPEDKEKDRLRKKCLKEMLE